MGIYDRDYYREKSRFSPFDNRLQACVVLAVVYVCFFLVQYSTQENRKISPLADLLELKSSKALQGEVWRIFTYAFVQDTFVQNTSIFPLAVNLLLLIWIGRQVEDIYGWKEFLAYYLLAGFLAGVGFTLLSAVVPMNISLVGPAASLTATLLLFAMYYPRRTVLLFFIFPCPLWFLALLYVLFNATGVFVQLQPAALAAYWIAVYGAAAALAYVYFRYSLRLANWLPNMPAGSGRQPRSRPSLQIFRDESLDDDTASSTAPSGGGMPASASYASAHKPSAAGTSAPVQSTLDEHLEAKVDEVLKKVNKHGQASLTDAERAVLFRASEIYRKRRKSRGD